MVAALCACDSGSKSSSPSPNDLLLTPGNFVDSISVSFGDQWGASRVQILLQSDEESRAEFDVDDFLAGLRSALMIDEPTPGLIKGASKGVEIAKELDAYSAIGIYVDRGKVMNAIEKVLTSDTLSSRTVVGYQARFDDLIGGAQNKVLEQMRQARRKLLLAEGEKRRNNEAAAKAFVEKLKTENADIKRTDSGLFYLIADPGHGKPAKKGTTLSVAYEIKGLDGRLIDSSRGEYVDIPFDDELMPGLQEGFAMLAPGADATFYIPYLLGFGSDHEGVNPGEMIVVRIKLNDAKR